MSNAAKRLLPMEEADDVLSQVEAVGFDLIRLVASTTTDGRLHLVLGPADDLIYYVAIGLN